MKTIAWLRPHKVDLLIYDIEASRIVWKSVPSRTTVFELETRNGTPLVLKSRFVARFLKHLVRERSVLTARFFALFDEYDPEVIISLSAMNDILGKYAIRRPDKLVIAIQNAVRSPRRIKQKMKLAPVYFCFGEAEKNVLENQEIPVKEIVTVGSYPMGVLLSRYQDAGYKPTIEWDLCLVSAYRDDFEDIKPHEEIIILKGAHDRLFSYLVKFARIRKLKLAVVGRQRYENEDRVYQKEFEYFRNLACDYKFDLIAERKENLSSYKGALHSKLVVNLLSTLGWEVYGLGKKVLFGGGIHERMISMSDVDDWVQSLPSEVKLLSNNYIEFEEKVRNLLVMNDDRYRQITEKSSAYCMAQDAYTAPHDVIKKTIEGHLAKQSDR